MIAVSQGRTIQDLGEDVVLAYMGRSDEKAVARREAAELGNSASILMRHYRELVTTETAAEFWSMRP